MTTEVKQIAGPDPKITTQEMIVASDLEDMVEKSKSIDEIRTFLSPESEQKFFNTTQIRATQAHVDEIIAINNAVYKGYYPYLEMLDPQYLSRALADTQAMHMYLVHSEKHNKNVGAGMVIYDAEHQSGYLRGLMMMPEYSAAVDLKKWLYKSLIEIYHNTNEEMRMYYTETRTAHNKAQYLMEMLGCKPCAMFFGKDTFTETKERETDVFDIAYSRKMLATRRNKFPIIHPKLENLFNYIAKRYHFSPALIVEPNVNYETFLAESMDEKLLDIYHTSKVEKHEEDYNVVKYRISTKNGSELKFMITTTVMNAEKSELKIAGLEDLFAILLKLEDVMHTDGIQYFEVFVPATNPDVQEIFFQQGFSVFGYVPAWTEEGKSSKYLTDCVVFGKYAGQFDVSKMKLTKESEKFLEVIRPLVKFI